MPKNPDVFLSHNSKDRPAVRELAAALRARGLEVWLDADNLLPGQRWQEELEKVIKLAGSGAVLVGGDGFGPWEDQEMRAILSQFVQRRLPVIPVLLPGAPMKPELPLFLAEFTWSDLRGGLTPSAVDRLTAGIRQQPASPAGPDPLDSYRAWIAERYNGLSLIGLGGGDLGRLLFDEVYVPLRIVRRRAAPGDGAQSDELGIENLFTTPEASNPHALVLGDPGAGKTTGLLKLLHLCLAPGGPAALGIEPGTLPVFLRLRRFTPEDLDRPFEELLQRELERELGEVAADGIAPDLGARLWEHGRLLLLLDGLDEIADAALRARVCELLDDWELSHRPHLRAVLSCRFSGYGAKVRLDDRFAPLEVRPLDAAQCRQLVRRWFRAAQRALPDRLSKQDALTATDSLINALDSPGFGSQRWKVLIGSPLLLTLLCVIAYRGGQMPKHRTAFYDQCLRVLLGPWSHGKRDGATMPTMPTMPTMAPPLDAESALAVLRAVAWELHRRGTWGDLSVMELAVILSETLAASPGQGQERGRALSARQVLEWLHREAGVLASYGEHRYGLLHLGLQEYLAACHIASRGTALLDELCLHAGEEWWQEVFLLLAGLPGHAVFTPLLSRLLKSDALLGQADLLRACLDESGQPGLEPFVEALAPGVSPARQAAALRLLRGHGAARLESSVRALLASPDADVKALAGQILDDLAAPRSGAAEAAETEGAVFVLHQPEDREIAGELAAALRRQGWRSRAAAEEPAWREDPDRLVREARGVIVLVGRGGGTAAPWHDRELASCLKLFARNRRPIVLARLAADGLPRPEPPEDLGVTASVDFPGGLSAGAVAALNHALAGVLAPTAERTLVPGDPGKPGDPGEPGTIVEPSTRIRFVWIPGGRFVMGGTVYRDEQPPHAVRVSPFWLGETPVTNAQYAVFLDRTGTLEPRYWRDRRFSSPDQPVVGMSWKGAQAFCSWLAETWGRPVSLPSEAQWELAARGLESREYPWGDEPPDATRACFGLDWQKDQPAPAGSYPAGRGPFGTLDQAGNVWEWCRDAWEENAYALRAAQAEEAVDPCVEGDEGARRVLRGGGWDNSAGSLRAALRNKYPARNRYVSIGFRVAAGA
jgi:formylglycine-generating enzyme required for sulfatase activity